MYDQSTNLEGKQGKKVVRRINWIGGEGGGWRDVFESGDKVLSEGGIGFYQEKESEGRNGNDPS